MSQSLCPLIKLSNGVGLPQLGMGLWEATDDEAVQNVHWAVKAGYRHLDTAYFYKNEESVGRAIKTCGIPREELFVTTKLWNADHGYDQTLAACERSLKLLGLEYLDLYLIHWPGPNPQSYLDTWRAMEKLYEDKKVRAIGVSNFEPHHIDDILKVCKVAPMVNQIEMHPLNQQEAVRAYCQQKGIAVTAWRPLGKGALLSDPVIGSVAEKYGRSPAQVILRWMIQLGVVTIPKSSNERRIQQNFAIFDFQLEPSDMDRIRQLNKDSRFGGHPDSFFPTE